MRAYLLEGVPAETAGSDLRVFTFTAVAVLFTALVAGIAPALHSSRTDAANALRSGSQGATARRRVCGPRSS